MRLRLGKVLLAATATVLMISSCSDGLDDVRANYPAGWPTYGGNAHNANYSYRDAADNLELSWTRPTGGPIAAPTVIGGKGTVNVTSDTTSGCNIFAFDPKAGRKNWCTRFREGAAFNAQLIDQFDYTYIGEPGRLFSLSSSGVVRWRFPTLGMPLSAKFAGPDLVLMVTNQGQVMLFNAHTGEAAAPGIVLRDDSRPNEPDFGLGDCVSGRPNCPVSSPPALDPDASRAYLNIWPKNAIASQVQALDYGENNGQRTISKAWSRDIPGGVIGAPTLSADAKTLYVFDRIGNVHALEAESGKPKWSQFVGGYGFGTLSVSESGVIIPTGVIGSPVVALVDRGNKAEIAWRRDDLQSTGTATQTAGGTTWLSVAGSDKEKTLSLVQLDKDGKTVTTLQMPGARGYTTGVAIGPSGEVATATGLGEVFFYNTKSQD